MLRQLKNQMASEQGGGSHYWHLHRQHIMSRTSLWWQRNHHTQIQWLSPNKHPQPLLLQHCSPLGLRGPVLEGRRAHTTREWSQLMQPSGLLFQQCGPTLALKRVVTAIEQRGCLGSHLALALAPSSLTPPSNQLVLASTLWRNSCLVFKSNSAFPPKPLYPHELYRDTPKSAYYFKLASGKCFTEFHKNRGS